MDEHERWWTVKETAGFFRVHEETIRLWLRSGRLRGACLSRKAGWRIDPQSAYEILNARGEPIAGAVVPAHEPVSRVGGITAEDGR